MPNVKFKTRPLRTNPDGEAPRGLAGMVFGAVFGLSVLGFGGKFLQAQLGIQLFPQIYYFFENLLPYFLSSVLPRWTYYVFYALIGMVWGLMIDLANGY